MHVLKLLRALSITHVTDGIHKMKSAACPSTGLAPQRMKALPMSFQAHSRCGVLGRPAQKARVMSGVYPFKMKPQ